MPHSVESARVLGYAGAIFHVHGKDCGLDQHNTRRKACWTRRAATCTIEAVSSGPACG
ncbi:MAG: hypothetical protein U1D55_04420 [Phycisphaerae bacterium]